jgi:hypothetical protein
MTPFRRTGWSAALVLVAAWGGPAGAAWDNVFQVCCNSCRTPTQAAKPVVVAAYPTADPGPSQCQTRYVQRSYYQAVTTYQPKTVVEPVTSYRTSYYYEPVVSYTSSSYYDPCSGAVSQVTTPTTSFRLRSQTSPVTNYLQRTMYQPVTSYQLSYYLEPQTTCTQTTIGAPIYQGTQPAAVAVPAPPTTTEGTLPPAPPTTAEGREPPPNGTGASNEQRLKPIAYPQQGAPTMPPASDGATFRPASPQTAPRVRLDRIVSATHNLEGEVVDAERKPTGGARVLLVSADKPSSRQEVTTDGEGRFQASLANGVWLVYFADKAELQTKVEVRGGDAKRVQLVSR